MKYDNATAEGGWRMSFKAGPWLVEINTVEELEYACEFEVVLRETSTGLIEYANDNFYECGEDERGLYVELNTPPYNKKLLGPFYRARLKDSKD